MLGSAYTTLETKSSLETIETFRSKIPLFLTNHGLTSNVSIQKPSLNKIWIDDVGQFEDAVIAL